MRRLALRLGALAGLAAWVAALVVYIRTGQVRVELLVAGFVLIIGVVLMPRRGDS
ncbi:MAG TPA: hypothetical protein VKD28_00665 [Gemmatimonadales bacterium]|nr:hypothetical protein [Gemmatimonadales bacterium]